jgi:lipid-binding SYLF domain-containing protein
MPAALTLLAGRIADAQAASASARQINHDADRALGVLYAAQPKARDLGKRAKAILVFPETSKTGLLIGGQSGDGALGADGKPVRHYNISATSFGLQAGRRPSATLRRPA